MAYKDNTGMDHGSEQDAYNQTYANKNFGSGSGIDKHSDAIDIMTGHDKGQSIAGWLSDKADKAALNEVYQKQHAEEANSIVEDYCNGNWDAVIAKNSQFGAFQYDGRLFALVVIAYCEKGNYLDAYLTLESFRSSGVPNNYYSEKTSKVLADWDYEQRKSAPKAMEEELKKIPKEYYSKSLGKEVTDEEFRDYCYSIVVNFAEMGDKWKEYYYKWRRLRSSKDKPSLYDLKTLSRGNESIHNELLIMEKYKGVGFGQSEKAKKIGTKVILIAIGVIAALMIFFHFTYNSGLSLPSFGGKSSTEITTATATANMEMYKTQDNNPLNWIKTINTGETVIQTGKTSQDGKWTEVKHGNRKGWVETRFLGVN